jgi:hypothetical protein
VARQLAFKTVRSRTRLAGAVLRKIVEFIVQKVVESAAPFVGGASALASGIVDTIDKAIERTSLWWERRKIVVNPGHFELIANLVDAEIPRDRQRPLPRTPGRRRHRCERVPPRRRVVGLDDHDRARVGLQLIDRLMQRGSLLKFQEKARDLWDLEKARATRSDEGYEPPSESNLRQHHPQARRVHGVLPRAATPASSFRC